MTVEELEQRMSHRELASWVAYAETHGPLNPSIRIDAAIARLAVTQVKNGKMSDFLPYPKEREEEATLDDFMGLLGSAAAANRKRN